MVDAVKTVLFRYSHVTCPSVAFGRAILMKDNSEWIYRSHTELCCELSPARTGSLKCFGRLVHFTFRWKPPCL